MTAPLDDSRAKLRQANLHADTLHREVSAFRERKPALIVHDADPQTGDGIFRMALREEPPLLAWGTIVGDVLHNLHSALDCLAWQLAIAGLTREPSEQEARGIYFPLSKDPAAFRTHAILRHLSCTHRTMLDEVQPYQRGHEVLRALYELSRRDKHRVVHPTYLMDDGFHIEILATKDCEVLETVPAEPGPFEDGRELARVKIRRTGPQPETEGHAKLTGLIALSDGTPLQSLIEQISASIETILDRFEPTLP